MEQTKKSFLKIKVKITSFLIFIILALLTGYYLGSVKIVNGEKTDLSQMYKVWDILEEEFLDTRTAEEKVDDNLMDKKWGIISGLVNSYKDPYTVFLPPSNSKELNEDISGEFGGVGIEIENRNGLLTVVSPLPKTPADKAGIKPKDIIVEIDGKDSINISAWEASRKIRGEPGSVVILTIARKNTSELLKIEIKRDIIKIPTIKTYKKDGVFIIKIFSFTEQVPELFFEAVQKFSKSGFDKLIIDLRGNPGGHLFAAVYVAGMFLPEDSIIVTEEYGNDKKILKSGQYHKTKKTIDIFSNRVKVGILVNEGSASASEILAGALRDNNRAVLMGANTYGKGTVQKIKEVGDGASLKYTIAKFILPSGNWISHKGIPVDIEIDISEDEIKKSRENGSFTNEIDSQMTQAVERMQEFKTQKDILKVIQETRNELKEKNKKEREEKLKKILNKN